MNRPVRAVLFDVDGTLYRQTPVRAMMAAELVTAALTGVSTGTRVIRILRAFRTVREEMRGLGAPTLSLVDLQFDRVAERIGEPPAFVRHVVEEWILQRPVKYLRWARRPAVITLLRRLRREGIPLGVLSDYPADAKLEGLGLATMFSVVACTTDEAINAFKPHPRGFLHACALLRLDPADVAYVGDRADVDAAGARAAGMTCYLVGRDAARCAPPARSDKEGFDGSRRFEDLERICFSIA